MAIITSYVLFRSLFAAPAAPLAPDALPEWPASTLYRSGGFSGTITIPTLSFPMTVTCNGEAPDAVAGADEFDWFFSQQTSDPAGWPFVVSRNDALPSSSYSGSILLTGALWAGAEYPSPLAFETVAATPLYKGIDIYARRRSDGAIQRFDLRRYLYDQLRPKVDLS